jgi:hypothetical protein
MPAHPGVPLDRRHGHVGRCAGGPQAADFAADMIEVIAPNASPGTAVSSVLRRRGARGVIPSNR